MMPDDQPKVPEGVLEAFRVERRRKRQRSPRNRNESALAAALAQHHKELLGDEAVQAAGQVKVATTSPGSFVEAGPLEAEECIRAAINSVMKGGDGD